MCANIIRCESLNNAFDTGDYVEIGHIHAVTTMTTQRFNAVAFRGIYSAPDLNA